MSEKFIPYGRQSITPEDVAFVNETLISDWITQGPKVDAFEKAVADYVGAKYAVAVSSATAALHISCLALGLKEGDELWTSPNTFVASANCGLYCGANVDFVDIDSNTYNLSFQKLKEKLFERKKTNQKMPKILVPVHFSGQSCDMEPIKEICDEFGIKIVEDASHAIGGSYKNKKIGCGQYSDVTVFSFHPVKNMTTGEGGMVLTNNEALYNRLLLLRSHGITRDESQMAKESEGPWYYQQIELGFNYRITDIQCALGLSQMQRLDLFIEKRNQLAKRYIEKLAHMAVKVPFIERFNYSAFHLFVINLKLDEIGKTRKEVFAELREKNIGVNVHYIPVHLQPFYKKLGFNEGDFAVSEQYYAGALSLPLYYDLSFSDQDYIIDTLYDILE